MLNDDKYSSYDAKFNLIIWLEIYVAKFYCMLQFVNFTEIMSKNIAQQQKEAAFALAALMEIPSQFKAAVNFNLLK